MSCSWLHLLPAHAAGADPAIRQRTRRGREGHGQRTKSPLCVKLKARGPDLYCLTELPYGFTWAFEGHHIADVALNENGFVVVSKSSVIIGAHYIVHSMYSMMHR